MAVFIVVVVVLIVALAVVRNVRDRRLRGRSRRAGDIGAGLRERRRDVRSRPERGYGRAGDG